MYIYTTVRYCNFRKLIYFTSSSSTLCWRNVEKKTTQTQKMKYFTSYLHWTVSYVSMSMLIQYEHVRTLSHECHNGKKTNISTNLLLLIEMPPMHDNMSAVARPRECWWLMTTKFPFSWNDHVTDDQMSWWWCCICGFFLPASPKWVSWEVSKNNHLQLQAQTSNAAKEQALFTTGDNFKG